MEKNFAFFSARETPSPRLRRKSLRRKGFGLRKGKGALLGASGLVCGAVWEGKPGRVAEGLAGVAGPVPRPGRNGGRLAGVGGAGGKGSGLAGLAGPIAAGREAGKGSGQGNPFCPPASPPPDSRATSLATCAGAY